VGGLERDVIVMGLFDKFELWDKARYEAIETTEMAAGPPKCCRVGCADESRRAVPKALAPPRGIGAQRRRGHL